MALVGRRRARDELRPGTVSGCRSFAHSKPTGDALKMVAYSVEVNVIPGVFNLFRSRRWTARG